MARILEFEKSVLASELAKLVVAKQNEVLAKKDTFEVAISGGSLAATLKAGLADDPEIKWKQWRVWLADERIVPFDHEDSNIRLFIEDVYNTLPEHERPTLEPLSKDLIAEYESTPTAEFAAEYESRLKKALGEEPRLDFAFLGMGPDGHTCSLFPGHPLLDEWKLLVAPIDDSPKPPSRRITLTKPVLKLVSTIAFVTTGSSKAPALRRIFGDKDTTLPSAQVNEIATGEVIWFADKDALSS